MKSFCLFVLIFLSQNIFSQDLTKYINPFIGTGGEGHNYPGATVPFGMIQPGPDTHLPDFNKSAFPWCAGYQYNDSFVVGFSQTHFSGTGHSDMGDFLIMPTVGEVKLNSGDADSSNGYRSRISKNEEWSEPGYYGVMLKSYNIKAEITATERTAFYKFSYPQSDNAHLIMDLTSSIYNYEGKIIWSEIRVLDDYTITGYRQTKGWAADRKIYFAMKFSKPIESYTLVDDEDFYYKGFGVKGKVLENYPFQYGRKVKAHLDFKTGAGEIVYLKIAISPVGTDGALKNLEYEIPEWNFDKVKSDAKSLWQKELEKVNIEAPEKEKQIFYTSYYHSLLAPVIYSDVDGRYRGVDGNIHTAEGFTNYTIFSLWDTYRAEHPMFTILQPNRDVDMINSMLAHQQQSVHKFLPVWSFHGNETWCMIGYHSVSVIADAYLKGIKGFDEKKALDAMTTTATYEKYGGLKYYMLLGYVPQDKEKEGASKTLEYAYDDWCISQMAFKIGNTKTYDEFIKRAVYFRNNWDAGTRFFRAKNSDGSWNEPFDPLYAAYGGDYTEGNGWQYSWYVPQDVHAMINLYGGNEKFIGKLDSLFILKTEDEKYKQVEDIAGLIGQYAQGNEPSHHVAYLYNWAGAPWKTQEKIHMVMNNLFDNTPDGICGNEDCGQMSAWYIFSSMGFYPVCPGSLEYIIGTPKLNKVELKLDNGKIFSMIANNLSHENFYIQSAKLNGKPLERSYITHSEIMNGGELIFEMGASPNKNLWTDENKMPYSMTK